MDDHIRCYCTEQSSSCVNNTCYADIQLGGYCEIAVDVFDSNNTVSSVMYWCVEDLLSSCHPIQPHPELGFTAHSYCCMEDDCNRCQLSQVPGLSDDIIRTLPLPEGCPAFSGGVVSSTLGPGSAPEPTNPPTPPSGRLDPRLEEAIIALSVAVFVVGLGLSVLVIVLIYRRRVKKFQVESVGNISPFDDLELTISGSSGSGQRVLEERTIAKQIKKKELIGKGRYGEVWLGQWNGEDVAIKIFSTLDEDSWRREEEIFQTQMLHHENIVRFIALDKKLSQIFGMQLWMVMEYHCNGSLFDYLFTNTLTSSELQKMVLSIGNGLQFLHFDVTAGHSNKPGIAHRDLKSRNILVKEDGTCCITDFGLAVKHNLENGSIDRVPSNPRQGTKRYMAPEILDGTINVTSFESYRLVDMYCFGLIMWEMARRCRVHGDCDEYQLPYFDAVTRDPSFDEMKKVVAVQEVRPTIEERWKDDETLSILSAIMQECWRPKPHARLTAFRVKKKLQMMYSELKNRTK